MNEPTRSYEKIRYEVYDGVARITLDDPDTRNALSDQLLSELIGALEEARDDYAVRVVVLASSLEKVFSAGGNLASDLSELYAYVTLRLTQANLKNDDAALEECRALVKPLQDAWQSIAQQVDGPSAQR